MDGIGIIILAVIVILSTFNDKKKRPKQQAKRQPAPKPFDPFGLPGPLELPNRPAAPTIPAPAKPTPAVRPAAKPKTAARPATLQSEPRISATPKKAENSIKTAPEAAEQPATTGVMTMAAEARHEVLQEFDPKLAILYGEIMQPKFQEYE